MTRIRRCRVCHVQISEATAANSIQYLGGAYCGIGCWRRWKRAEAAADYAAEQEDEA